MLIIVFSANSVKRCCSCFKPDFNGRFLSSVEIANSFFYRLHFDVYQCIQFEVCLSLFVRTFKPDFNARPVCTFLRQQNIQTMFCLIIYIYIHEDVDNMNSFESVCGLESCLERSTITTDNLMPTYYLQRKGARDTCNSQYGQ